MRDDRVAGFVAAAVVTLAVLLELVIAGSVALDLGERAPAFAQGFATLFGGLGAGLAWPLLALLSVALAGAAAVAAVRPDLRSGWHTAVILVGAGAWIAAVAVGVRPPASHTGVFTGGMVYGTPLHPDAFIPCLDPARPLPRGADLGFGRVQELPLWAAVRVPDRGWHGSHPDDWPHTVSDSHGGLYFQVRVRGTLTGPGWYGMPPGMQYRLRIDSVLSTAPRHAGDPPCPGTPIP